MKKAYWYETLAGLLAGLLFAALSIAFPFVRALSMAIGGFPWAFVLFCAFCSIVILFVPWFRRRAGADASAIVLLLFFAAGALAAYLLMLFAVAVAFILWQPQIL